MRIKTRKGRIGVLAGGVSSLALVFGALVPTVAANASTAAPVKPAVASHQAHSNYCSWDWRSHRWRCDNDCYWRNNHGSRWDWWCRDNNRGGRWDDRGRFDNRGHDYNNRWR